MLRKYKIGFLACFAATAMLLVYKKDLHNVQFRRKQASYGQVNTTTRTFVFSSKESIVTTTTTAEPELNLTSEFLHQIFVPQKTDSQQRSFLELTEKGVQEFESAIFRPYNPMFAENNFYLRRDELRSRCNEFPYDNKIDLSRMVYDDRHKVIMCVVPKDACTAWKSIMWYLKGKVNNQEELSKVNSKDLILEPLGATATLKSLPLFEATRRLLEYTTFFVTRHPFERLVSAYSSKFSDRYGITNYRKNIGKDIAIEYRPKRFQEIEYKQSGSEYVLEPNEIFLNLNESERIEALNYADAINTGKITFPQFARYLTQSKLNVKDFDVHWRPQVTLCNPCLVNYDYIIRFEKLVEDSNVLLEYVQKEDLENEKIFFKNKTSSLIGSNRTSQAFDTLSYDVIEKLRKLYAHDFNVMGYST